MHGKPAFAPDSESIRSACTRLAMLLSGATDDALAKMTAEGLAGTHHVARTREASVRYCETALRQARETRQARRTLWHD